MDRTHGRRLGDGGHEPVPAVVTAKELALGTIPTPHQQEVAISGLDVEHLNLRLGIRSSDDGEEFPLAVGLDVEAEVSAGRSGVEPCPPAGPLQALEPGPDPVELPL